MAPYRESASLTRRTFSCSGTSRPSSVATGLSTFSSTTWFTSSFDQVMRPFSTSDVGAPVTSRKRRSTRGRTSSVSRSTTMYSSSTPYCSKSPAGRSGSMANVPHFFEALFERPYDRCVQLFTEHPIFDVRFDARVVVDLDEVYLAVDLFQVHTVEPVPDEVCGLEGGFDNGGWHVFHRQHVVRAGVVGRSSAPVVDLPVPFRHVVLAGKEGLPVQNAEAPVKVGRHVFLCDDEVGSRQHVLYLVVELLGRLGLHDASGRGSVGELEHARQAELGEHLPAVVGVYDDRFRRGQLRPLEELGKVHFVRTAQDRVRIVDHGKALGLRPASETVGVMVDRGGFADEEGVELRHAGVIVARDELD